jgi:hypothetical protein
MINGIAAGENDSAMLKNVYTLLAKIQRFDAFDVYERPIVNLQLVLPGKLSVRIFF